jgi:hypothetical protein
MFEVIITIPFTKANGEKYCGGWDLCTVIEYLGMRHIVTDIGLYNKHILVISMVQLDAGL